MKLQGHGCLPETDGRNFMALLDMCHFLVDQITQRHNFADVEAASMLRATDTQQSALLTAQMYSYWSAAPAGPGVYEMLCEWTASQPGAGAAARLSRETGQSRARHANPMQAALHALAVNECKDWPRRRKTGAFYFAGEDASGAALLVDEKLQRVYRVVGLSTSLGDMMRAGGRAGRDDQSLLGSSLLLTLLPFMGTIVYDGTLRGAPPNRDPGFVGELVALAAAATDGAASGDQKLITELPTVVDAPLVKRRVRIDGLQAKPELNGQFGTVDSFDDPSGRYCVRLEEGGASFKLKPANLTEAAARPAAAAAAASARPLTSSELALQERLKALTKSTGSMWVFRRMGYSEDENPQHMGMIMDGGSGMVVGTFQSKRLAPTADEYLKHLEPALFGSGGGGRGVKPSQIAVDEQGAVERLKLVLEPAGITCGYYPPPTEEELSAMGVPQ